MKKDLAGRVERSLRRAALWDEVKDRLKDNALGLSGGQQQRLCIARAIAVEPDVLLMDEPASALDPISTAKIEELIDELKQDYTIVIVTHNMVRCASGVTRIRQRAVAGPDVALLVSNDTPSDFRSWPNTWPSWSSRTLPI